MAGQDGQLKMARTGIKGKMDMKTSVKAEDRMKKWEDTSTTREKKLKDKPVHLERNEILKIAKKQAKKQKWIQKE